MEHSIYYDEEYTLYYLFRKERNGPYEIDIEMTSDIKSRRSTLMTFTNSSRYHYIRYAILTPHRNLKVCSRMSQHQYISWFSNQRLLSVFLREKGIDVNICQNITQEDPDAIWRSFLDAEELADQARLRPFAVQAQGAEAQEAKKKPNKPNTYVSNVMLNDAIQKGKICSITHDLISIETSTCVSPCYHCFTKSAIQQWLSTNSTCPECREKCTML